jgi:very-long-chain enoyl-CoA reductase
VPPPTNIELTYPSGRPIKGLPESITIESEAPASQIFNKIAEASKFSIHRLRVTKGSDGSGIPNAGETTVHQTGLRNKSAIDVKDLGMLPCA